MKDKKRIIQILIAMLALAIALTVTMHYLRFEEEDVFIIACIVYLVFIWANTRQHHKFLALLGCLEVVLLLLLFTIDCFTWIVTLIWAIWFIIAYYFSLLQSKKYYRQKPVLTKTDVLYAVNMILFSLVGTLVGGKIGLFNITQFVLFFFGCFVISMVYLMFIWLNTRKKHKLRTYVLTTGMVAVIVLQCRLFLSVCQLLFFALEYVAVYMLCKKLEPQSYN